MSDDKTIADDHAVRPAPDAEARAGGYYSDALAAARVDDHSGARRASHIRDVIAHLRALSDAELARTHVLDDGTRVMVYDFAVHDERRRAAREWLAEVDPR